MDSIISDHKVLLELEERFSVLFSKFFDREVVLIGECKDLNVKTENAWHRITGKDSTLFLNWNDFKQPVNRLQEVEQQLGILSNIDSVAMIIGANAKLDLSEDSENGLEKYHLFQIRDSVTRKQLGQARIGLNGELKCKNETATLRSTKAYLKKGLKIRVKLRLFLLGDIFSTLDRYQATSIDRYGKLDIVSQYFQTELSVNVSNSENVNCIKVECDMDKEKLLNNTELVSLDLGQIDISLDDLLNLRIGSQISLDRQFPLDVLINVGGAPWATGQLTQDEEGLKVTVDQLLQV